jgi:hypothetical protein
MLLAEERRPRRADEVDTAKPAVDGFRVMLPRLARMPDADNGALILFGKTSEGGQ